MAPGLVDFAKRAPKEKEEGIARVHLDGDVSEQQRGMDLVLLMEPFGVAQ